MSGSMPAPELPLSPIFLWLCVTAAELEGQQSEKTEDQDTFYLPRHAEIADKFFQVKRGKSGKSWQIAAFHVLVINNVCFCYPGSVQSPWRKSTEILQTKKRKQQQASPASLFFAAVQYLPFFSKSTDKDGRGMSLYRVYHKKIHTIKLGLGSFSAKSSRPPSCVFQELSLGFYDCARFARYPMMLSLISPVRARL